MNRHVKHLISIVALLSLVVFAGVAYAKKKAHKHHDALAMTKDKLKTDGTHQIHKSGKNTASAEIKGGKIAKFHVKHDVKGEVALKKVKSKSKVAMLEVPDAPIATDTIYAYDGYCYLDDDDVENCYWYPVEIVIDDFTGAIEYVEPLD